MLNLLLLQARVVQIERKMGKITSSTFAISYITCNPRLFLSKNTLVYQWCLFQLNFSCRFNFRQLLYHPFNFASKSYTAAMAMMQWQSPTLFYGVRNKIPKVRPSLFLGSFVVKKSFHNLICPLEICDSGWLYFEGYCYKRESSCETWTNASTICLSYGSNLARIDSVEEDVFVQNLHHGRPSWIGLNDQANEGVYLWTDGAPVSYTHWKPGVSTKTATQKTVLRAQPEIWNITGNRHYAKIAENIHVKKV